MKHLTLIVLCGFLLACAELRGNTSAAPASGAQTPPVQQVVSEPEVCSSELVTLMENLVVASDAQWSSLQQEAEAASSATDEASERLRMALVLSTPGRENGDDARAAELLRELVSQPSTLSEGEVRIARLRLAEIRERAELRRELHELQDSVAELEAKIRALTQIEETVTPTGVPGTQ